jgi:hypothetical protein
MRTLGERRTWPPSVMPSTRMTGTSANEWPSEKPLWSWSTPGSGLASEYVTFVSLTRTSGSGIVDEGDGPGASALPAGGAIVL